MIQELSSSADQAPDVPRHRLHMSMESLQRNVGGGWSLSGVGLGEGVSLVKAANGQVYRMMVTDVPGKSNDSSKQESDSGVWSMEVDGEDSKDRSSLGAFHEDSLSTIAAVNQWRCSGFPLYGQVRQAT